MPTLRKQWFISWYEVSKTTEVGLNTGVIYVLFWDLLLTIFCGMLDPGGTTLDVGLLSVQKSDELLHF